MQSYSLATVMSTRRPRHPDTNQAPDRDAERAVTWLEAISQVTGPRADPAVWLRPPAPTAISRAEAREHRHYTLQQRAYLHRVDAAYALLAARDPHLIELPVTARDTPTTVHHRILDLLPQARQALPEEPSTAAPPSS